MCEYFKEKISEIYIDKEIDMYFDDVELVTNKMGLVEKIAIKTNKKPSNQNAI